MVNKKTDILIPRDEWPTGYWPNIAKATVKQNKEFARTLFEADLPGNWHWFDYLDCSESWGRKRNEKMTLDLFLKNLKKDSFYSFHMQHSDSRLGEWERIYVNSLCYRLDYIPKFNGNQFFWLKIPWNNENNNKLNDLFKDIYKTDIILYPRRGE